MYSDKLGIIGAGPSGLAVSLFLDSPSEILECSHQVGGHAASFVDQGFTFDYGPHILFSRDQKILDFLTGILGSNVSRCRRNNKISIKNRLLKYPFENDLASLSLEDNYACLKDFVINPFKEKYLYPSNMREWLLKKFGESICSLYLFPYNEKVWNLPVEKLSSVLAERIPDPPAEDIIKSSLGFNTEGYLHQLYYYYPAKGGYQVISEALAKTANIEFDFDVKNIELGNKIRLTANNGKIREYNKIISTMPVHELVNLVKDVPDEIKKDVENLIVNPMYVISFGIKGIDENQYTAIYFPESEFLVNRVSYPCTFSSNNGPAGYYSIQAEITCTITSDTWKMSDAAILKHVRVGLQKRGLLPATENIVLERVDRREKSYVVYDCGYETRANRVRTWFAEKGIHLLGRFGNFQYINIDMAVEHALHLAITQNGEKYSDNLKQDYLQNAREKLTEAGIICE